MITKAEVNTYAGTAISQTWSWIVSRLNNLLDRWNLILAWNVCLLENLWNSLSTVNKGLGVTTGVDRAALSNYITERCKKYLTRGAKHIYKVEKESPLDHETKQLADKDIRIICVTIIITIIRFITPIIINKHRHCNNDPEKNTERKGDRHPGLKFLI